MFTVTLPVHKAFFNDTVQTKEATPNTTLDKKARRSKADIKTDILRILKRKEFSTAELTKELGYSQQTSKELFSEGLIVYTEPDNKHSMFQRIKMRDEKSQG